MLPIPPVPRLGSFSQRPGWRAESSRPSRPPSGLRNSVLQNGDIHNHMPRPRRSGIASVMLREGLVCSAEGTWRPSCPPFFKCSRKSMAQRRKGFPGAVEPDGLARVF